jgi:hypothetical protein
VAEQYKNVRVLDVHHPDDVPPTARWRIHGPSRGRPHPVPAVAFLEPGVLALGELRPVKKAIDAGPTATQIRKDTELTVFDVMCGTGNAWFVARTDVLAQHTGCHRKSRTTCPR